MKQLIIIVFVCMFVNSAVSSDEQTQRTIDEKINEQIRGTIYDPTLPRTMWVNREKLEYHMQVLKEFGSRRDCHGYELKDRYGVSEENFVSIIASYCKSQGRVHVMYDKLDMPVSVAFFARGDDTFDIQCNEHLPNYCRPQKYVDTYRGSIKCSDGVFQVYHGRRDTYLGPLQAVICLRLMYIPEQNS